MAAIGTKNNLIPKFELSAPKIVITAFSVETGTRNLEK